MTTHFRQRLQERYGMDLTEAETDQVLQVCRERRGALVANGGRTEEWYVEVRGRVIRVVYRRDHDKVLTCVPLRSGTPDRAARQVKQRRRGRAVPRRQDMEGRGG